MQEYGTDFVRISHVLGKSRDQVKRKFKVMEKKINDFGFKAISKAVKWMSYIISKEINDLITINILLKFYINNCKYELIFL